MIRQLDVLWADLGMSKAELVRRVNRNASSVRRLSTAGHVRPELALLVALAERSVPSCVSFRSLGRSGSSSRVRDVCAALSVTTTRRVGMAILIVDKAPPAVP